MQTQIKRIGSLIWVNVIGTDFTELKKVLNDNGMNESLAEEIADPILSGRMDNLRNAIYLSFTLKEQVDCIVKSNIVITSSKKEIPEVKSFVVTLEKVQVVTRYNSQSHGGVYFAYFLKTLYQNYLKDCETIFKELEAIEENILITDERNSLEQLVTLSKKISEMFATLRSHKIVLDVFKDGGIKTFGPEYSVLTDIVLENYRNVLNSLDRENGKLRNLKETLSMIIATKNNKTIKVFTVVCIIILPLVFIASFFGMSTVFPKDLATDTFGTIYVMSLMLFFSLLMLAYLHFKKII